MRRFLMGSVTVAAPAHAFLPDIQQPIVVTPNLRASGPTPLAGASVEGSFADPLSPGYAALVVAGAVALAAAGRARRTDSRRSSLLGAVLIAQPAHAEEGGKLPFGLDAPGQVFGSFPQAMDPKKSVIIGEKEDEKIKKAVTLVTGYNDIAKKMEAKLKKDAQADIDKDYSELDMHLVYLAVSDIIEIFDEGSSSALRLSQRNLNQQWYLLGEVAPFPTTKKGEARPRGPIRTEELMNTVKNYYTAGEEVLKFVNQGKVKA